MGIGPKGPRPTCPSLFLVLFNPFSCKLESSGADLDCSVYCFWEKDWETPVTCLWELMMFLAAE